MLASHFFNTPGMAQIIATMSSAPRFHSLWMFIILLQISVGNSLGQKVSSVAVVGSVFCDHCSKQAVTKNTTFLQGASVAIFCKNKNGGETSSRLVAVTDEKGSFKAELPPTAYDSDGHVACSAILLSSSNSQCRSVGLWKKISSDFVLQSKQPDKVVYSVGTLSFLPQKAPSFCSQASFSVKTAKLPPFPKLPPIPKLPSLRPPFKKFPSIRNDPFFKLPKFKPPFDKAPEFKPPSYKPPQRPTKSSLPKPSLKPDPKRAPKYKPSSSEFPPKYKSPLPKLPPLLPKPKIVFPKIPKHPSFKYPPKFKFPPKFPREFKHPPFPKVTIPKVKSPTIPFPKFKFPFPP